MGKAKMHWLTLQDDFATYMYWICFDFSCNQELVSTQGFHMAKRCDRVFSSKVKQIMESQGQGHPLLWEGRSFKTKMYIICIAWTTYSRWNLFCSISRILFSRLPLLQGAPFLVCSTKQNTTLWQTMPPIAGPAQKLEFDICRLFRSGSPMPAAAGCASRPPLQSQSTHLHWNTGCCYVTTWNIKRRKSV